MKKLSEGEHQTNDDLTAADTAYSWLASQQYVVLDILNTC